MAGTKSLAREMAFAWPRRRLFCGGVRGRDWRHVPDPPTPLDQKDHPARGNRGRDVVCLHQHPATKVPADSVGPGMEQAFRPAEERTNRPASAAEAHTAGAEPKSQQNISAGL